MEFTDQILTFAVTIVTGALLGILFDIYRVLHRLLRVRSIFTALFDLLYWLIATCIIFLSLLISNWGELRFYIFLGLLGGAVCYFKLLSRYVTTLLFQLLHIVGLAVRLVKKIVIHVFIKPVAWIIRVVFAPFAYTKRKAGGWFKKTWTPPDDNIPPKS